MNRLLAISFIAAGLGAQTPDTANRDMLSARLEAAVPAETGALRATLTVTASGAVSLPYRDAYMATAVPVPSESLFGSFVKKRQFRALPLVENAIDPERPIRIQLTILEDDFMLPVQRQVAMQFALLPNLPAPAESGEGKLKLGAAGIRREEIIFALPENFSLQADRHVEETRDFAHYRSDATLEAGKLTIVRELEMKQSEVGVANRAEMDAFWKLVRDDQERVFVFRRIARVDLTAWIASVPAKRANTVGVLAQQNREYAAARQLFEKAIADNPNDRSAWNNLGRALAALGKLEEAQQAFRKQVEINPSDQYAYNNLGLVQERLGNWAQAIDSLKKELQVHPGDTYATSNLPVALIHMKRWAEAEEAASRAAAAQPANLTHRLNLAVARVCDGTAPDARKELDAALGARPSSPLLNNAAYYLTECGKEPELAESYIRRALEIVDRSQAAAMRGTIAAAIGHQNTLSTHLDTYAWLLFKTGKIDRALELFDASVTLSPRADVFAHFAEAEAKAGRSQEALIHWREATLLEPGMVAQVPAEAAGKLKTVPALSSDRGWYPINADLPENALDALRPDQACYFFAISNPDGTVQSARALDPEDPAARQLAPAIRALSFRVVKVDANPIPTAHIVRIAREKDGPAVVSQSVSTEALAIASELAPGEFPLPAPAAPATVAPVPAGAYRVGNGVAPPRLLGKTEPVYSEEALKARLMGTVGVSSIVGADGKLRDLKIVHSLGLGLDEKAMEALTSWRFEPGTKDGHPVNVVTQLLINFRLLAEPQKIPWHLARFDFKLLQDAARPTLRSSVLPRISGKTDNASVTLTFDVDQNGEPANIQIDKASDDEWAHDAVIALTQWRFDPGRVNHFPVTIPAPWNSFGAISPDVPMCSNPTMGDI